MCGINGVVSSSHAEDQLRDAVARMNSALAHRGPDNEGIWNAGDICLGHRRLSIIDLSPNCNQPFFSADKKHVIVYNGELYNYRELKLELQRAAFGSGQQPYFFSTNSDTEVVIAAYLRWGKDCLHKFNGMYAFAIYDIEEKKLFIARDRIGVKPLYYSYSDAGLVFSSEIRAIVKSGFKSFSLNQDLLAEYAMYQTIHAPNTIVKGIKMLLPGHYMEFENAQLSMTQYYDLNKIPQIKTDNSYQEICNTTKDLLSSSVQRRMVSDVPFGAFLSGGIDSSIVVGLMSQVSAGQVETFNVSFDEGEFSEAVYARMIAKKFGTKHHEIKLRPIDFLNDLPEALAAMDHPGGDGPNTYVVSKATKAAGIKMALSGIGGDELFAGYDVFKRMESLRQRAYINHIPRFVRKGAGALVSNLKKDIAGQKISELLALSHIGFDSTYPLTRSLFTAKELKRNFGNAPGDQHLKKIIAQVPQIENHLLSSVTIAEMSTYMQNVLLRDADQMGMSVALEIREPFLDYRLIEHVIGLEDIFKFPVSPKKLLVDSVGDLLPPEVVNRKKMGFTLPWQHWMKHELKTFCETNIAELAQRNEYFGASVKELWQRFLKNDPLISWSRLWPLIVLNAWLNKNHLG